MNTPPPRYLSPKYHPSVASVLRWFEYEHLPAGLVRDTSQSAHDLAYAMADRLDNNQELTAALRDLLKAKDGFVRTAIDTKPRLSHKEPTEDE